MRNKNQPIKYKLSDFNLWNLPSLSISSRGRVVKAIDQKSIGLCPRRFESCRLRTVLLLILAGQLVISDMSLGVGQKTQRRACPNLQLLLRIKSKKIIGLLTVHPTCLLMILIGENTETKSTLIFPGVSHINELPLGSSLVIFNS